MINIFMDYLENMKVHKKYYSLVFYDFNLFSDKVHTNNTLR